MPYICNIKIPKEFNENRSFWYLCFLGSRNFKDMKKINLEMYKTLLFNIWKRVEETGRFSGFDINKSHQISLENLWKRGKKEQAITLLICYHYSRKESVILKTYHCTYSVIEQCHFSDIAELIGLSISDMKFDGIKINSAEFEKIYTQLEDEVNQLKKKMVSKWLMEYDIDPCLGGGHLCRLYKTNRKEFIIACILYMNSREGDLKVEVNNGEWIKVAMGSNSYTILEKRGIV